MIRLESAAAAALVAVLSAFPAAADEAAGRALAAQWCEGCHVVSPDQQAGQDAAPAFTVIAAERDDDAIRAFLAEPHWPMPPLELSRRQIDDLVAYIRGQAG